MLLPKNKWGTKRRFRVLFLNFYLIFSYVVFLWHAHVCLCVCICAHRCLKKSEEDGVSVEVGIAGGYEPLDMGTGKQTPVLCTLTC